MDNFFINMFRKRESEPIKTTDPQFAEKLRGESTENSGSYEERIITARSPQMALTIPAVYRATELRAKTEAQFQPQYQVLNQAGGNFVPDLRGYGRRINYLLQMEPNPTMTGAALIEGLSIHRLMAGNGIAYIERDVFGDVVAIWLCCQASYDHASGLYFVTYEGEAGTVIKNSVPRQNIIHWPNTFKTPDGLWGIPTLRFAFDTLSLIKTQQQQALESAAKGGRVKLLIGEAKPANAAGTLAYGMFSKPEMKKYAQEVNRDIYKQDVVALRGLDKVQQISMTAQEMQMAEFLNMGVDDVARFWGTPRPLLMADSNSHYTTPVQATLEFMTRTIQPDVMELEQEFGRKLIGQKDFGRRRFHMCEQPLLRLDKEAQAKVDQLRLQTGSATVNEIRKQYDMPSVENGDIVYVSTNLAELGSEKLRSGGGNPEPKGTGEEGAAPATAKDTTTEGGEA